MNRSETLNHKEDPTKQTEHINTFRGVLEAFFETGTEGVMWAFQDERFISTNEDGSPSWSYDGLHILENGDELTIYSPEDPSQIIWQGEINFKSHPVFTETVFNHYIHSDQEEIDRETWAEYFFKGYPAQLKSKNS